MDKLIPDFSAGPVVMAAPLQGHTDAAWRDAHAELCGGIALYFSPFARVEHGDVRARDLRDSTPSRACTCSPQIIFRDISEFDTLCTALAAQGHTHIDLNLGCPFPPQVRHGRGAGVLLNTALLQEVAARMAAMEGMSFSVKMRLGVDNTAQWHAPADAIAAMPLTHVVVHPRSARQQYSGAIDIEAFSAIASALPHPVVFNGDIRTRPDIDRALERRHTAGVMIGRGLLARPSLAAEWLVGHDFSTSTRRETLLTLHERVYAARASRLCGEAQILNAMRPFWEYAGEEIDHKTAKAIHKATTLAKYLAAVQSIHTT